MCEPTLALGQVELQVERLQNDSERKAKFHAENLIRDVREKLAAVEALAAQITLDVNSCHMELALTYLMDLNKTVSELQGLTASRLALFSHAVGEIQGFKQALLVNDSVGRHA